MLLVAGQWEINCTRMAASTLMYWNKTLQNTNLCLYFTPRLHHYFGEWVLSEHTQYKVKSAYENRNKKTHAHRTDIPTSINFGTRYFNQLSERTHTHSVNLRTIWLRINNQSKSSVCGSACTRTQNKQHDGMEFDAAYPEYYYDNETISTLDDHINGATAFWICIDWESINAERVSEA